MLALSQVAQSLAIHYRDIWDDFKVAGTIRHPDVHVQVQGERGAGVHRRSNLDLQTSGFDCEVRASPTGP